MKRFGLVLSVFVLLIGLLSLVVSPAAAASTPIVGGTFGSAWARTDLPVATGKVSRTWMWGPQPDSGPLLEPYAESPGGERLVQYFDKSRMEITRPNGDPNSIWYVTNGLLAEELITGRMQFGDDTFKQYAPARVNVAGDLNDPNGPTYATFNALMSYKPIPTGWIITQTVNRAGKVGANPTLTSYGAKALNVGAPTHHTVASVFWTFMTSSGLIDQNGKDVQGPLFPNAFYATGYPLTEPYWTTVLVGGKSKQVLVQVFERRVMTYTPSNPAVWRVESGNVGLQYYQWRYVQLALKPVADPNPPAAWSPPPSMSAIASVMTHTVEVHDPTEHFTPAIPLTISDGNGGTLTAVVGIRYPTADAYGQLVFFWHDGNFLGWDTNQESNAIQKITSPAPGEFAVTYPHYAASDPVCCPSLEPVTITYRWNGTRMVASGTPPNLTGVTVQLAP